MVRATAGVFEEYGGFIRAVIRFQAHNRSEEEDFFQGFFLALIHRPVPAEVHNFKSYLYQAITNYIRDAMRRRVKYRYAVKKYASESRIPINNRRAENVLIEAEENDAVFASFARRLQPRQAQAFLLRYRDNFAIGEIAAKMGVNGRTVSRYLSQSLKTLRKALAT